MISEIIQLLKQMRACVSYGDYDSIKQLSNLELEKWKQKKEELDKKEEELKKEINKIKKENHESYKKEELINIIEKYIIYFKKING